MNFQNAADTLARLANQHQGLIDLAQTIQDLGGLANAKDELTAQVAQLRQDTSDATAALLAANNAAKEAEAASQQALDEAKRVVDGLLMDAHNSAALVAEGAKQEAEKIIADANVAAQAATVVATTTLSTLQSKVDELTAEVSALEKSKADAEAATADAQAKFDAIKAQIAKLAA